MKKLLLISYLIFYAFSANSQDFKCQDLYVWEFLDQDDQRTVFTKDLTNSVEEALVNIKGCSILQRRQFSTLQSQVISEKNIQSAREIKSNSIVNQNILTTGAKFVVFGILTIVSRKEYELRIRVESLQTTKIVKLKSIDLDINDLVDNNRKKAIINNLVKDLMNIEETQNNISESSSVVNVKSCLGGYKFFLKSITGNSAQQTVTMQFIVKHSLPNQYFESHQFDVRAYGNGSVFMMNSMSLGDRGVGTQNTGYMLTNSIPTDISLAFSVTIGNVLENVKKFDKVMIPIFTHNINGGGGNQGCTLEIKDIPIAW